MGAAQAGQWGSHVANGAIYKLPYDLLADFAPVAWIANGTPLIVSRNSVPAATLTEFIAWLKANPGKTMEGTAGVGSPQHIAGVYFQSVTGTRFQFVPYRGVAPAMQDLLAGNIDFMIDQATNSLPQVPERSGPTRHARRRDWPLRQIYPAWTRPACRNSICQSGRRFGFLRAHRGTSLPSSIRPSFRPWAAHR